MQQTTSSAAGNGLFTTIKYLCGATGIGLGTTWIYSKELLPSFCVVDLNLVFPRARVYRAKPIKIQRL
jgi:hypothetical protein